jgi:MoxR-like ATPase
LEVTGTLPPVKRKEKVFAEFQRKNTLSALRACAQLTGEIADYKCAIPKILTAAKNASNAQEKLGCHHALSVVRDNLKALREKFAEVAYQNPEAFYVVHSRAFRRYSRQLNSGRIAVTPFVADKIDEVLAILHTTRMAILHGPTGSGKSEVAEIVAQKFSGRKPLVISGHRDVSARELKGHDALRSSVGAFPTHEVPDRIEAAKREYQINHPDLEATAARAALKQIEERFIHENAVTVSEFVLGYAYRAAKEGIPLIIDEFNLIDPTVVMGLNSLMTKRPGEVVHIPENGHPPFPVADGFCVIMTGNLNTGEGVEYYRPHQPDASTTNRFLPVKYGFPPQATEGTAAQAHPSEKQLYQIMIATLRSGRPSVEGAQFSTRLEDRAMLTHLPGGAYSLDKLWRLAKLAAITQLALEGKVAQDSPHAHRRNGTSLAAKVEHALTPRVVVNLLEQWKGNGFEFELDHYIFNALVESALTAVEKDYFYRQCQLQGFCMSPGWPEIIDDGTDQLYSEVRSPKNPCEATPATVPGRILIKEINGDAPERASWPGGAKPPSKVNELRGDTARRLHLLSELDKELGEVKKLLEETRWLEAENSDDLGNV